MSKRKPIPAGDNMVLDDQGRRRFHGAFTGGFSAGYFNTVGSKEGFTPQTFVSSRRNRFTADDGDDGEGEGGGGKNDRSNHGNSFQKPEDFMDEEDGLLGAKLTTKDGFQLTKDAYSSGIAGGGSFTHITSRQDSNVAVNASNMGYKLLSTMGWKAGQGVGARVASKTLRAHLDSKYADNVHDDDDEEEEEEEEEEDTSMMGKGGNTSMYLKSVPQSAVQDGRITFAAPEVSIKLIEERSLVSASTTSNSDSRMYNHSAYEHKQSKSYLTLKRDQFGAGYMGNLLNELGQDLGDAAWSFAKSARKVDRQHPSTTTGTNGLPEVRNSTNSNTVAGGSTYGATDTGVSGGASGRRVHLSSRIDEEDVYATEDSSVAYDHGIDGAMDHSTSNDARDGSGGVDMDEVRMRADAVLQGVQRYPSDNRPVLEGYSLATNMEEVYRAFSRLSTEYPPLEVPISFVAGHVFADVPPPPRPPLPSSGATTLTGHDDQRKDSTATIVIDAPVTTQTQTTESKVKRKSRFSRFQNLSKEELLYGPAFIALSPMQKQQLLSSVSLALVQQIYNRENVYRAAHLLPPPSAQINTFVQSAALSMDTTSTAPNTAQSFQRGQSGETLARSMLPNRFDNDGLKTALQSRFTTAGTTLLHQTETVKGRGGEKSMSDILSKYTDSDTTTNANYSTSSLPPRDAEPDWSLLETQAACSITDWMPSTALCKSLGIVPPVLSVSSDTVAVKVDKREEAFEKNIGQHISTTRPSTTSTSNIDSNTNSGNTSNSNTNSSSSGDKDKSGGDRESSGQELDEFYGVDLLSDNDPPVSLYKAVFENKSSNNSNQNHYSSQQKSIQSSTDSTQPSKRASHKLAEGDEDMNSTRILFRRPAKKHKASMPADSGGPMSIAPLHMQDVPSMGIDISTSHSTTGLSAESAVYVPSSGSSSDVSDEEDESHKSKKKEKTEKKARKKEKKKERKEKKKRKKEKKRRNEEAI